MKKGFKIFMLGAMILLSAQGVISATDPVFSNENSITKKRSLPKISVSLGKLSKKHTGNPFKDISTSIFKNDIIWTYNYGITTGYTTTSYQPDNIVTRGEMAVFLWRLAGSPRYNAPFNVYTDVNQYKTQILWLSATGITNGTGMHYDPNGKVTRGQMAAFLHRLAVTSGNASASDQYEPYFRDSKKHMFANDIGWMKAKGIADSRNTNYNPDADVTRGEIAAFLQRFYEVVILKMKKNYKHPTLPTSSFNPKTLSSNFITAVKGKATGSVNTSSVSSIKLAGSDVAQASYKGYSQCVALAEYYLSQHGKTLTGYVLGANVVANSKLRNSGIPIVGGLFSVLVNSTWNGVSVGKWGHTGIVIAVKSGISFTTLENNYAGGFYQVSHPWSDVSHAKYTVAL